MTPKQKKLLKLDQEMTAIVRTYPWYHVLTRDQQDEFIAAMILAYRRGAASRKA